MIGPIFFLLQPELNGLEVLCSDYWFYVFDATSFHFFFNLDTFSYFWFFLKSYHIILILTVSIGLETEFNWS